METKYTSMDPQEREIQRYFKQKTLERMCRDSRGHLFVASLFFLLRLKLKNDISYTNVPVKDYYILRSDTV
jgi:hypothetical protein